MNSWDFIYKKNKIGGQFCYFRQLEKIFFSWTRKIFHSLSNKKRKRKERYFVGTKKHWEKWYIFFNSNGTLCLISSIKILFFSVQSRYFFSRNKMLDFLFQVPTQCSVPTGTLRVCKLCFSPCNLLKDGTHDFVPKNIRS